MLYSPYLEIFNLNQASLSSPDAASLVAAVLGSSCVHVPGVPELLEGLEIRELGNLCNLLLQRGCLTADMLRALVPALGAVGQRLLSLLPANLRQDLRQETDLRPVPDKTWKQQALSIIQLNLRHLLRTQEQSLAGILPGFHALQGQIRACRQKLLLKRIPFVYWLERAHEASLLVRVISEARCRVWGQACLNLPQWGWNLLKESCSKRCLQDIKEEAKIFGTRFSPHAQLDARWELTLAIRRMLFRRHNFSGAQREQFLHLLVANRQVAYLLELLGLEDAYLAMQGLSAPCRNTLLRALPETLAGVFRSLLHGELHLCGARGIQAADAAGLRFDQELFFLAEEGLLSGAG